MELQDRDPRPKSFSTVGSDVLTLVVFSVAALQQGLEDEGPGCELRRTAANRCPLPTSRWLRAQRGAPCAGRGPDLAVELRSVASAEMPWSGRRCGALGAA